MDNTADMITRIRNASSVFKKKIDVVHSKKNMAILKVLKSEGYIEDFHDETVRPNITKIVVTLRYKFGSPAIREIKQRSKQQCREYKSINNLDKVYNGLGLAILSTSQGVLSDYEAREKNLGGEVICQVF